MADALLIGAGDLGTEIGLRLVAAGHGVVAVRRRAELVPPPLTGVAGDVREGIPDLPPMSGTNGGPRFLVVCLSAGGRAEEDYRATFLDGVKTVLGDVRARGWVPERAVSVSSTGVCAHEGEITEETPAAPSAPTSAVLLDAERAFLAALPHGTHGTVVRLSGLYGPGRGWFIEQVREGKVRNPLRMTHRVHRDDAAAAIVHLLTMRPVPKALYLVTDDEPALAADVASFVAARIGVRFVAPSVQSVDTRRLRNRRLRETGFSFGYPTYREGYEAIIAGKGARHP